MKTLEVRGQQKLLGWVDVPDHIAREGQVLRASVRSYPSPAHFAKFSELPARATVTQLDFPIELYQSDSGAGWWSWRLFVKVDSYEADELVNLLQCWRFRKAS